MPASFSRREAQLTLWLFLCFWVVNIGRCQVESDKHRWEVVGLEHCCCCQQPTDTQAFSLALLLPHFTGTWKLQFHNLGGWWLTHCCRDAISITAFNSPVGLFYFCSFLTLLARLVCAVSLLLGRGLFLWLCMGRASSLWDNLPCLFDHTYLCCLHLLKIFTRKATWVSVSPGAHLSVTKWKEYAFISFLIHVKNCQSTCLLLSSWERPSYYNQEII